MRVGNQKLKDLLTVVITTHVLPSAPSVETISNTIQSIKENFTDIEECEFIIYCDSDTDNSNHDDYINNLNTIENVIIKEYAHKGFLNTGLRDNYIRAAESSKTPFVLFCEHDWIFLREINTTKLINAMKNNEFINYVRFNKRDNDKSHKENPEPGDQVFWETYVEEQKISDCYFMKTDCIATHPHILRVEKFKNDWSQYASIYQPHITGIVETNLNYFYKMDITNVGFKNAHKKWGIYNYGSKGDKKIITHSDGSNSGRT